MKVKNLIPGLCVFALALQGGLRYVQAENSAAVADVLKLKNAGLNDDTIVSFTRSKDVACDLSPDDILVLRDKSVSTTVLNAMLSSGTRGQNATPKLNAANASAPTYATAPSPAIPTATTVPAAPTMPQAPTVGQPPVVATTLPPSANPDVAYFYQELSPQGRWILVEDNQWYWQPSVELTTTGWRPY